MQWWVTRGSEVNHITRARATLTHPTSALLLILLAGDRRLLEVKLALDLAAGLVVDLAVAQQLVDVLALGRDQVHAHAGTERRGVPAFLNTLWKLLAARLVAGARQCQRVVR